MGLSVPRQSMAGAAADPYFLSINDRLADKGFLVTTADDLINWARTGSLRACLLCGRNDASVHAATILSVSASRRAARRVNPM